MEPAAGPLLKWEESGVPLLDLRSESEFLLFHVKVRRLKGSALFGGVMCCQKRGTAGFDVFSVARTRRRSVHAAASRAPPNTSCQILGKFYSLHFLAHADHQLSQMGAVQCVGSGVAGGHRCGDGKGVLREQRVPSQ
jgi:hypothetical protein